MAVADECSALTNAFSGLGVEESTLISTLGKWRSEQRKNFRKSATQLFSQDERQFEKWNEDLIPRLRHEFLRFKSAIVLWTMHPWERDARLMKEAVSKGPEAYALIVEIACTRSSEDLLGARKAYHSLFDHSMEEDVAFNVNGSERKLLVALVSSYRYEGSHVHGDTAKSEARILHDTIRGAKKGVAIENYSVVTVLSARSKLHLKSLCKYYKDINGKSITEDLHGEPVLKAAVECLRTPETYFSEALDASLKEGADEFTQEALTRIIVSQADINIRGVRAEYKARYGVDLTKRIEDRARGNFKDFLLSLVARGD